MMQPTGAVVIDYTPAVRQQAGIGRIIRGQIQALIAADPGYDLRLFVVGRVDEGETAAIRFQVWSVGILQSMALQVLAESLEALHLKGQMGQVRLNFHRPGVRKVTQLNRLLA